MTELPELPENEHWFIKYWRPACAWIYILIVLCDFILFPLLYTIAFNTGKTYHEWHPLTLQGGGMFHLAMGSIIGVYSWQRSQEKIRVSQMGIGFPMGGGSREEESEKTEDKVSTKNSRAD